MLTSIHYNYYSMDKENKELIEKIIIVNKKGVKEYLKNLKFPVYFLDFEAITNSKNWMFENKMDLHQQISSFSLLKINSLKDDETKIKHFNFVEIEEDYKLMAKKMTDFYKDNGSVLVWGRDLEIRGLGKLISEADESGHKKLAKMIANMIDLQQLFFSGSFIKLESSGKSSLESIARGYGVYLKTKVKDGKKAHYILEYAASRELTPSHSKNINKRIEEYNNSDVINIKRVLVEVMKSIDEN